MLAFNIIWIDLPLACRLLLGNEISQGRHSGWLPRGLARLRDVCVRVRGILIRGCEGGEALLQSLNSCQQVLVVLVLCLWGRGRWGVRAMWYHAGGNWVGVPICWRIWVDVNLGRDVALWLRVIVVGSGQYLMSVVLVGSVVAVVRFIA